MKEAGHFSARKMEMGTFLSYTLFASSYSNMCFVKRKQILQSSAQGQSWGAIPHDTWPENSKLGSKDSGLFGLHGATTRITTTSTVRGLPGIHLGVLQSIFKDLIL